MIKQWHGAPIDIHAHIVPPTLVEEAKKSGKSLGVVVEDTERGPALQFEGLTRLRPLANLTQVTPRIAWMDRQGLRLQILASWLDIQGYTLRSDCAATWARLFNEHLAYLLDQHKDRFRGLATVPIQDGRLAAKELEYAVSTLGMLGIMLATDPVGQDLARDDIEPLWETAEGLNVPVVLHPPTHGFGANVKPSHLAFSLGRTMDTTITATKLILGGIFDRHPELKIVLVHGGGYLPYQAGRIDQGYQTLQEKPSKLQRGNPSDYLSLLYYDTVAMSPQAVSMIRNIAGADHIVLGSDYVFSGPERSLMEPVERAGLTSSEVASVCCQNALQLFLKEN